MKPTELRLGNCVYSIYGNVVKITVIDETTHWAKPIQLTEEWLLKLGFEFGIQLQDFTKGKYKFVQLKNKIIYGDFSEVGIFYFNITTKLLYVHQLQNLYFALTGEELTIE